MNSSSCLFCRLGLLPILAVPLACTALSPSKPSAPASQAPRSASTSASAAEDTIQPIAFQATARLAGEETSASEPSGEPGTTLPAPMPVPSRLGIPRPDDPPFAGQGELGVEDLVQQVLARNPTLAQMTAAWEAAQARYPQAISLDDPMLQGGVTPSIFGGEGLHGGWQATLSQKYYWPGKLQLRGERTLAEARAAANDVDNMHLLLVEGSKIAYYDYYLVQRSMVVNRENIRLLTNFRASAADRYQNGLVTQQDLLQADVELGRARERGLLLEQARQIAVARLNTLLNLPPDSPLPRPPAAIQLEDGLPPVQQLRSIAVSRRPELQALNNRISAQIAALRLAHKEYCPDFEVLASYNSLWQAGLQQPLLGVRMNLPVRLAKRDAAVREARALIVQLRDKLTDQTNQVNFQVQQAYAQVEQGRKAVRLYEDTVVPAARRSILAARSYYGAGKITFLRLLDTERSYFDLLDRNYQLIAEFYRRKAELERAVGGPLTPDALNAPGGAGAASSTCPAPSGDRR